MLYEVITDLEVDRPADRVEPFAQVANLVELGRNETLAAEARVDCHDEHEIDVAAETLDGDRPGLIVGELKLPAARHQRRFGRGLGGGA